MRQASLRACISSVLSGKQGSQRKDRLEQQRRHRNSEQCCSYAASIALTLGVRAPAAFALTIAAAALLQARARLERRSAQHARRVHA